MSAGGLLDPTTVQDPFPFLAARRAEAPVWTVPGTRLHLVLTRALVVEALGRTDDLSSNLTALLYTADDGGPALFDMTALGANVQTLATADPPAHTTHRRAVFPSLVERRMRELEPLARSTAVGLAERAVAAGRVDLTASFTDPLPMTVLAAVLGLPDPDLDRLLAWAFDGTALLAGTNSLARMAELSAAAADAGEYLGGVLAATPPDPDPERGLVGVVARAVADAVLTPEEAVSTLVILLGAGGESTTALIGNAVRILAERPDLQADLRARPERIGAFVEEVLRFESPFTGHYRSVRRDCTLGGTALCAGDTVLLSWAAANRDPAHWVDPDRCDPDRADVRDHLGFGRGIHHCVGAPLARMEAEVALTTLLAATTSIALDPERPPVHVASVFVRRHDRLPVVLTPA